MVILWYYILDQWLFHCLAARGSTVLYFKLKYGNAKKEIEDIEKKKCSEFGADGFRCVPFYACKEGEIITNGAG